ncbi:MAG: ABC transporter permease [Bacillota bacterium]
MKPNVAFKYIKASKSRTTLTILGIALALALMLCIGNFFSTVTYTMVQNARENDGDYHVRVMLDDTAAMRKLLKDPRIEKYGFLYDVSYALPYSKEQASSGQSKDNPFPSAFALLQYDSSMEKILPVKLTAGRMPEKEGEIVLCPYSIGKLGDVKIGDTVRLETGKYDMLVQGKTIHVPDISYNQAYRVLENHGLPAGNNGLAFKMTGRKTKEYTVVGIMKDTGISVNYNNGNGTAIVYPEDKTQIAAAYCLIKGGASLQDFINDIRAKNAPSLSVNEALLYYTNTDYAELPLPMLPIITALFVFVSCIVGLAAISIVRNTFSLTVTERLTDYGLLRCAGATPKQVLGMLSQEVGFMLILAVPLGLILGTSASLGLIWIVNSMDFSGLPTIYLAVSPLYCIISVAIGLIATFIAVTGPLRTVTRISPVEVTRGSRLVRLPRRATRQNRLAKLVFGFEGDLSLRNMKRNGKRSRTVLVSMTICVALFICASALLTVMSKDFERSGRQNIIDVAVTVKNSARLQRIYPSIRSMQGIQRIHTDRSGDFTIGVNAQEYNQDLLHYCGWTFVNPAEEDLDTHKPAVYTALHIIDRASFNEIKGSLNPSIGYDEWAQSGGVLVYNYFQINVFDDQNKARIINGKILPDLKTGQKLSFEVSDNSKGNEKADYYPEMSLPVTAEVSKLPWYIVPSPFREQLVLFIPEENVQKFAEKLPFITNYPPQIIIDAGGNNVKQLAADIQKLDSSLAVADMNQDFREMKNVYLLFVLCIYGFVGVISLISCLNIINIISTNLILRRREFGLLQAVGMSVRQVRRLVFYESFLYSLKSVIYGVIAGAALMLLFFSIVAGQYATTIQFNYFTILYAALGAFLVSLIASWPTLRRLRRMSIVETLRTID